MHGSYHVLVGIGKIICGNKLGSKAEFGRARCQFKFNRNIVHRKTVWFFVWKIDAINNFSNINY